MSTVLVTELEYGKAQHIFEAAAARGVRCVPAPAAEGALAAAVRATGARHVLIGVERYVAALYDALPAGGVIARFGVGHDGVDKARASAEGLYCTNTPGVLNRSVAEYTIALGLAALRHVHGHAVAMRAGRWQPSVGSELSGKALAIIGCGPIGCEVARIASQGFGMRVTGSEIAEVDRRHLCRTYGFESIERNFAAVAPGADLVSLHLPASRATHHFIDRKRLGQMASGAWLINTARGAVVCENDLYDALADGTIAGAALDVFEAEPYVPTDGARDLRTLANCIMTPHVASSTREACERVAACALANIEAAEAGDFAAMGLLNGEVLTQ